MATNNAINLKYTSWNNQTYTFPNKTGTVALIDDLRTVSSTQTADYTLALADAQTLVYMNKATAVTLTIPTNASVAFPVDTQIDVVSYGAGDVSIAGAGGVTINSLSWNKKINWQYVWVTLKKVATDTWILIGNLKA